MAMSFKTKLFFLADKNARPELLNPFFCQAGDTYAELQLRLEEGGCVDWEFEFWNFKDQCCIRKKFKAMNPVTERVYMLRAMEQDGGGPGKRNRMEICGKTRNNDFVVPPNLEFPNAEELEVAADPTLQEAEVDLEFRTEEIPDNGSLLQSRILSSKIMENYKSAAAKLTRELQSMDFADHLWKLKIYDQHGVAVVKILYVECNKESRGTSGDHTRYGIQNLFTYLKKSHLHSALHMKQWCKRRDIPYSDHPKKEGNLRKPVIYTAADHRRLMTEGVSVLQSVNDSIFLVNPPFVVVGDVGISQLKSFWYKVRCKVDGEIMYLCPHKGYLRANLENHIHGLMHTKCCEDLAASSSSSNRSSAVSSGKWERPTARLRSTTGNQRELHSWFTSLGTADTETSGEASLGLHSDSILSLLCWGFRKKIVEYMEKSYRVDLLLNDPKPGLLWIAEPSTTADFLFKSETIIVRGCFRHAHCKCVYGTGEPLTNFTCCKCIEIEQSTDFSLRVLREGRALVKCCSRDTQCGKRVDYLSFPELAAHFRILVRKYREEKVWHWLMKSRIAQLKVSHRGLKLNAVESSNKKDVLSFCNNILVAHRTKAFGEKPALWDFLRDVAINLNRVRQGHRFSQNTKSFAQAMRIYGGRQMCDLFFLNFGGPSYICAKRKNKKGVQFIVGEHSLFFAAVAPFTGRPKLLTEWKDRS